MTSNRQLNAVLDLMTGDTECMTASHAISAGSVQEMMVLRAKDKAEDGVPCR